MLLVNHQKWMDKFEELKKYKNTNGHCNVPRNYSGGLGVWVEQPITKKKKLDNDKISKLESIGFVWKMNLLENQQKWMDWLEELKKYKKINGHCNVPEKYSGGLGYWVRRQRVTYKKGGLIYDKISRLESIGFAWSRRVSEQR